MTEQDWLVSEDPQAMLAFIGGDGSGPGEGPNRVPLSHRKLRLLACACVRQVWHLLTDPRSRKAMEVAERFADGLATEKERAAAWDAARDAARAAAWAAAWDAARDTAGNAVEDAVWAAAIAAARDATRDVVGDAAKADARDAAWAAAKAKQAALLREIAGNPWRPVTVRQPDRCPTCTSPSPELHPAMQHEGEVQPCRDDWHNHPRNARLPWLTPTVLSLAQAVYDERADDGTMDPVRLAILADALEEVGCDNEPLLRHLRGWEWAYGKLSDAWYWMRSSGPHVRGCWALDLILGKE